MGEFRLFRYAVRDAWRCGCGAEIASCPVWSDVLRNAEVDDPDAVRELLSDLRVTLRMRRTPGLVSPQLLGPMRNAHARATAVLADVYRATADVTGARVLVDS